VKEKNVLLFKFRCNIFIGVRIIKELLGSVASGTPCTMSLHLNILFCNKNWFADWNMCLMLLKVITFCSNTQCQGTFCCGAECLGFSSLYLNVWLIFNFASAEEQVTSYAQWTTCRNDFKFCICDYTGPLVREFCNLLWSKAAYPKYVLILEKLKGTQGS
jgi:hypothetical protein